MSFFGLNFGQNADIDIILDDQESRKMADFRDENGRKDRLFLFYDGESVSGKVNVTLHRKTNKLEHQGIKIEFIGQIELYYDRSNHHEFLCLVKELARPGELTQNTAFDFEFNQVEKPFESYTGANVRLRYFLRVTVVRRLTDMVKEMDLLVHTLATYSETNNPIKMEVGIEDCLHIEFEYNKSKYHLKDVIVGKIYFLLVRIKIKHMEVAILKRETTGSGPNTFNDNDTIAKYEIMDGAPVKGESIPIRVFLAGYDLTPTMRDINKKFSVRYHLNIVLVDEEERRYYKQQEITLWRKADRPRKPYSLGSTGLPGPTPFNHAMARHQGGDQPSQNIRTAPTPSHPNTPSSLVDPPGFPAHGAMQQQQQDGGPHPRLMSQPNENENSSQSVQISCDEDDDDDDAEDIDDEQDEEEDEEEETPQQHGGSQHRTDPETERLPQSSGSNPDAALEQKKNESQEVRKEEQRQADDSHPGASNRSGEDQQRRQVEQQPEAVVEARHDHSDAAAAAAAGHQQPGAKTKSPLSSPSKDSDDDRPLPPEDDSVPDLDDSSEEMRTTTSGVVDDDEPNSPHPDP